MTLPPLNFDLSLHDANSDSRAVVMPVGRFENDLSTDPFTISENVAFPLIIGDFVRAYENVTV